MKEVVRHSYKDGEISETRTLRFPPFSYTEENLESVIKIICKNLTPDLVTKKYREENATNPMFGHCYHSSQALFYLMDTDVLEQRTAIDYHDCTHWWLVDITNEKIYDITADQYYRVGQIPPYVDGKKKPWYGWKQRPHQRSLNLIMRVLDDYRIEYSYETEKA